jgi:cell division protein FtsQ
MTTTPTQERPQVRTPIDPRIRDRRVEVIREAGRRRLRITLAIASAIVLMGVAYLAVHSPLLDVDHVRVTGTRQVSAADVERAAHIHMGAALLFTDTGAIARRVERLPWVEHASVQRDFPGTIGIAVTEYAPTAFVRVAPNAVALVAANGQVVAKVPGAPAGTTEIVGMHTAPKVGAMLRMPGAANVMQRLPKRLAVQVRAIDVGGQSAALVLEGTASTTATCAQQIGGVQGAPQVRLGSFNRSRAKGFAALAVLDDLAGRPFTYVDVSAPKSPVSC